MFAMFSADLAIPDQLLKATVRTVPLPLCNDAFDPISNDYAYPSLHNGISESQYCAVDPNGLSSPCTGDDGGPLQVFHNIRTAHVVGIVSFGIGCNATMPHIYTRVAYYSEWIVTTVWPDKFNRSILIRRFILTRKFQYFFLVSKLLFFFLIACLNVVIPNAQVKKKYKTTISNTNKKTRCS